MATVTNWIDHLSASEVAGQVYPMVGSELLWLLAGIISGFGGQLQRLLGRLKSKLS